MSQDLLASIDAVIDQHQTTTADVCADLLADAMDSVRDLLDGSPGGWGEDESRWIPPERRRRPVTRPKPVTTAPEAIRRSHLDALRLMSMYDGPRLSRDGRFVIAPYVPPALDWSPLDLDWPDPTQPGEPEPVQEYRPAPRPRFHVDEPFAGETLASRGLTPDMVTTRPRFIAPPPDRDVQYLPFRLQARHVRADAGELVRPGAPRAQPGSDSMTTGGRS